MIYTEAEISRLKKTAEYYMLDYSPGFIATDNSNLIKVCNGCGPERWPANKRKALTEASVLKRYESTFAIHDYDYTVKDVSRDAADKRLRSNMIKIWAKDFGTWRWLKKGAIVERFTIIPAIYAMVAVGGDDAWEAADPVTK